MQGWGLFSARVRRGAVVVALALGIGGLGGLTAAADDPPVRPSPPVISVKYHGAEVTNCDGQTTCPESVVLGETAEFTFTGTSSDVVSHRYHFPGEGAVDVDGHTVTLTIAPPDDGLTFLQVQSINAIGQFSDSATFILNVGPRPGPVGSWQFDDGTGTTAADGPGLTHPLTLAGGAALDEKGRTGGSIALDGVDDLAQASGPVVDTSKSFSLSAWARPTGLKTGVIAAVTGTRGSAASLGYDAGSKRWTFTRTSADVNVPTVYRASSGAAPVNHAWAHLLGTYDAATGRLQLFVNGKLQQTTQSAAGWQATGPLTVGRGKSAGTPFAGSIDRLQVWQRVLEAEEIPPLVDPRGGPSGNDQVAAGVAAYWPLDAAVRGTGGKWHTPEAVRGADLALSGFGANQSAAFVDDGERGRVLEMTGRSRESVGVDRSTIDGSTSFSVAGWVKITDPARRMVIARQGTGSEDTWRLEYRPVDEFSSEYVFVRGTADGTEEVEAAASVDPAEVTGWHLLKGTSSDDDLFLAVDNRTAGFGTLQSTPLRAGTTTVGAGRTTTTPFNGRLDDFRVYVGEVGPTKFCTDYADAPNCGS
jgi:hypothetical protein